MTARVASLHVYPVKGCRGDDLETATVVRTGFAGDRQFMVVTPDGDFLTQREVARLALVRPSVGPASLRLAAPGLRDLAVAPRCEGRLKEVRIWDDTCEGIDQGDEVAAWFSELAGRPCRLVRKAGSARPVDPDRAVTAADEVSFTDGYPFLVTSVESLRDLNARLAGPLPMNRFRPSIVVEGWVEPFREDAVRRLRVGPVEMALVKPCARCVVTTTDQETAVRGKEPLRTLATFRRAAGGGVLFGQNAIPLSLGVIGRGDPVEVLAAG